MYAHGMGMKHPDQKLGRAAVIVVGLFIITCIVLLILAFLIN